MATHITSTPPSDDIWFAKAYPHRNKLVPVHPRGWQVVRRFIYGMVGSGLLGPLIAFTGPIWLGILVMAGGMAASGAYFILTAQRHSNPALTRADFKDRSDNA